MARFIDRTKAIKVGSGLAPDTKMGPLAHERRLPAMAEFVEDAAARGGSIELGGNRIGDRGYFFAPTVITNPPDDSKVMTQRAVRPDRAVRDVQGPRGGDPPRQQPAVWPVVLCVHDVDPQRTGDPERPAGRNRPHQPLGEALPETPFGGIKDSGIGSEGGTETFDGYLTTKFVTQLE